ncbi:acyl-CoA thioesterase [bacterium]|nr:acyl-CoA thioesterase [bacterium]RQV92079.1 MAG: acyl-CoA thioesterase [bacterium]
MNDSTKKPEHIHSVRVRYADVDRMGFVYHTRYLEWFEAARTELIRTMGKSYCELEEEGTFLPVVEAYCRYRRPVRYDELVRIRTIVGEVTKSKLRLEYQLWGEEDRIIRVEGYTSHCFMNASGKPMRASQSLIDFFLTI